MSGNGFGEELAEARRRNGYSVQQVSDALRIRPDIIRAIEIEDFGKMPAKGFARNQVSAYARFLGLNPGDLTQSFLTAYSEFERKAVTSYGYVTNYQQPANDRAYATARRAQQMMEEEGRQHNGRQHHSSSSRNKQQSSRQQGAKPRRNGNRPASGNGNGNDSRRSREQQAHENATRRRAHDATRNGGRNNYAAPKRARRRNSGDQDIGSTGFKPGKKGRPLGRLLPIIIIIVIIAAIAFGVSRCSSNASSNPDLSSGSTVQVTGGSETTQTTPPDVDASAVTATPQVKAAKATSFALVVSVADGASSWVQVDVDDSTPTAEEVTGQKDLSYTVTKSATVQVGNPDSVTVTVNGKQQKLTTSDSGLGTITLTLKDGEVTAS